jgi:hypothetical protein
VARLPALTPEQRAEEEERAREAYDAEGQACADGDFDAYDKYYGDVD